MSDRKYATLNGVYKFFLILILFSAVKINAIEKITPAPDSLYELRKIEKPQSSEKKHKLKGFSASDFVDIKEYIEPVYNRYEIEKDIMFMDMNISENIRNILLENLDKKNIDIAIKKQEKIEQLELTENNENETEKIIYSKKYIYSGLGLVIFIIIIIKIIMNKLKIRDINKVYKEKKKAEDFYRNIFENENKSEIIRKKTAQEKIDMIRKLSRDLSGKKK